MRGMMSLSYKFNLIVNKLNIDYPNPQLLAVLWPTSAINCVTWGISRDETAVSLDCCI